MTGKEVKERSNKYVKLKIEYNEAKKLLRDSDSVREVIEKYKKKES